MIAGYLEKWLKKYPTGSGRNPTKAKSSVAAYVKLSRNLGTGRSGVS
jgi:hypothetical protein